MSLGPRYGGELRIGVTELPTSLLPGAAAGAGPRLAAGLVHETLVGHGADGPPKRGLAESWTAGAEGRECTLLIDENARFHDDQPVTADDVVRSLRAFLRARGAAAARLARTLEGGPAFRSRQRDDVPGLLAVDGRRVLLRFSSPALSALVPLASPAAAITGVRGAGAGPFVPSLFVPGQRMALTPFSGHPRGRPFLDRIQVTAFPEPGALPTEAGAGRVELAWGEPGFEAPASSLLLVLDGGRPPFDRPEARALLAAAIDRGLLVGRLVPGGAPSVDLLPPTVRPPDFPVSAIPSTTTAGARLPGASATLAVSRDVPPAVSQRIVAHLAALGLGVRVTPESPAAAREASVELRLLAFSPEVAEPGLALEELLTLAPSPGVAARLEAAERDTDGTRRLAGLAEVHEALVREGALLGLGTIPVRFGGRPSVHDARVDAAGRLVLEDAWVEP